MTLALPDESAYREYFHANFTKAPLRLTLADGHAKIYFSKSDFNHAFFESTDRNGIKDEFSRTRAERMDDIPAALLDTKAIRHAGWNKRDRAYSHGRCVCLALDDFVVVVRLRLTTTDDLAGRFVTCFVADNSIGKIRKAPLWDELACRTELRKAKRGR